MDPVHAEEWNRCRADPAYFLDTYCSIYDATEGAWIPFHLWPAQVELVHNIDKYQLVNVLKARQLGISWVCIGYPLHLMIFRPIATISIFSRREEESIYLLSKDRMRGMYDRLPEWMRGLVPTDVDNDKEWKLKNGSVARAFPTTAGDSYTVTYALADEFDLVENQNLLIKAAKPTIDGGGKMVLVSRADKTKPNSEFKRLYRSGKERSSPWVSMFLPWWVRPGRTPEWYEDKRRDSIARTGSLDDVFEQYPATDVEALAARSLNKRIPPAWLTQCFVEADPLPLDTLSALHAPAISDLRVYCPPDMAARYLIAADPAEGNVTSDESSLHVIDLETGEEVALLAGKFPPEVLAAHACSLSDWYNRARIMPERNNHGHAFILAVREAAYGERLVNGTDKKPGWLTTQASKTLAFDLAAEAFREMDCIVHSFSTFTQLASIEAATQRAPEGDPDDQAMSMVIGLAARARSIVRTLIPSVRSYRGMAPAVPVPLHGARSGSGGRSARPIPAPPASRAATTSAGGQTRTALPTTPMTRR